MLTRLLPSKIALSNLSCCASRLLTHLARLSFSLASWYMRAREVAVKAVSEPEKNPDNNMRTRITSPRIRKEEIMIIPDFVKTLLTVRLILH